MATSCGSAEQISTGGTSVPLKSPRRAVTSDSEAAAGTRRYYDDNARIYSEASVWLPLNDAFEPFVARLTAGARVLDLGCGAGRDLRALSLRGFRSIGLDVSLPLVELAAQFSGCPVIQGDMRTIPFEDGAFGGIWASA